VLVLERIGTNSKYRCPRCDHCFSGGNQKIRVHITGLKEGGSSVKPCPDPLPEAVEYCSIPRLPYKKRQNDGKTSGRKRSKKNPPTPVEQAWELLHNESKQKDAANTILRLDEYGAEKAEDLKMLEPLHLRVLADCLKVVPSKVFLELLDEEDKEGEDGEAGKEAEDSKYDEGDKRGGDDKDGVL